jgi:hypothetical protein
MTATITSQVGDLVTNRWTLADLPVGSQIRPTNDPDGQPWEKQEDGTWLSPEGIRHGSAYLRDDSYFTLVQIGFEHPVVSAIASATEAVAALAEFREQVAREVAAFNERANEYAERKGLCRDYDEFMEEQPPFAGVITLSGRPQDVDYTTTIQIVLTGEIGCTARSADTAEQYVLNDMLAVSPGTAVAVGGFTFNVVSVEATEVEED